VEERLIHGHDGVFHCEGPEGSQLYGRESMNPHLYATKYLTTNSTTDKTRYFLSSILFLFSTILTYFSISALSFNTYCPLLSLSDLHLLIVNVLVSFPPNHIDKQIHHHLDLPIKSSIPEDIIPFPYLDQPQRTPATKKDRMVALNPTTPVILTAPTTRPQPPADIWWCCQCGSSNIKALMDEKCTVCNHTRDTFCTY
jgi:hypothetical protein